VQKLKSQSCGTAICNRGLICKGGPSTVPNTSTCPIYFLHHLVYIEFFVIPLLDHWQSLMRPLMRSYFQSCCRPKYLIAEKSGRLRQILAVEGYNARTMGNRGPRPLPLTQNWRLVPRCCQVLGVRLVRWMEASCTAVVSIIISSSFYWVLGCIYHAYSCI
jgi:hypothetical protein